MFRQYVISAPYLCFDPAHYPWQNHTLCLCHGSGPATSTTRGRNYNFRCSWGLHLYSLLNHIINFVMTVVGVVGSEGSYDHPISIFIPYAFSTNLKETVV